MAAAVRIGISEAVIDGYRWTSEDKSFEAMLNARLDPWGPSGADPNPDCTAAEAVAEELNGEVLWCDETEDLLEGAIP